MPVEILRRFAPQNDEHHSISQSYISVGIHDVNWDTSDYDTLSNNGRYVYRDGTRLAEDGTGTTPETIIL
jgi:hypothetical protein